MMTSAMMTSANTTTETSDAAWKLPDQEHGGTGQQTIDLARATLQEQENEVNVDELMKQVEDLQTKFEEKAREAYHFKQQYQSRLKEANQLEAEYNRKRMMLQLLNNNNNNNNNNIQEDDEKTTATTTKRKEKKQPKQETLKEEYTPDPNALLTRTCVVLVRPSGPANLGQISRICCNLGIMDLRVVDPLCEVNCVTARRFANKSVDFLMNQCRVFDKLEAAIDDCGFVVGTSGKVSPHHNAPQDPAAIGQLVRKRPAERVAIVFGNESHGLTAHELALCDEHVFIPMPGWYQSFNLSAAVAIVMYVLSREPSLTIDPHTPTSVPRAQVERLQRYMMGTMERFGIIRRSSSSSSSSSSSTDKQQEKQEDHLRRRLQHVHFTPDVYQFVHDCLHRINLVTFNDVAESMSDTGRVHWIRVLIIFH